MLREIWDRLGVVVSPQVLSWIEADSVTTSLSFSLRYVRHISMSSSYVKKGRFCNNLHLSLSLPPSPSICVFLGLRCLTWGSAIDRCSSKQPQLKQQQLPRLLLWRAISPGLAALGALPRLLVSTHTVSMTSYSLFIQFYLYLLKWIHV